MIEYNGYQVIGEVRRVEKKDCGRYQLTIPARADAVLVARMALSAVGALCGLDIDMLGDLRTVTSECCDCLLHQGCAPEIITVEAERAQNKLHIRFRADATHPCAPDGSMSLEVTRGILETLIPEVEVLSDERGVYGFNLALGL